MLGRRWLSSISLCCSVEPCPQLTMVQTSRIYMIRKKISTCGVMFCALGCSSSLWSLELAPLNVSGSVGFNYRLFDNSGDQTESKMTLGTLRANSYVWRPWLGTVDGSVTAALDSSDTELTQDGNRETTTSESQIYSGVINLNMFSQSRAPFNLSWQASDSRIDNNIVGPNTLIVLGDGDFESTHLSVRQAFITGRGDRFAAVYDKTDWTSARNGEFTDDLFGVEMDLKLPQQRVTARATQQTSEHSLSSRRNDFLSWDISHFFTGSAWRVDNKVTNYQYERWFDTPGNTQDGIAATDIRQLSSFVFWRPEESRWTLSGGLRAFDLSGSNTGVENDTTNLNATLGALFQLNKKVRLDASLSFGQAKGNSVETTANRQRIGALYQSDLRYLKREITHRWYATAAVENNDDGEDMNQGLGISLGHTASKSWAAGANSQMNASLGQALNGDYQRENDSFRNLLNHTGSLNWNQTAWGGNSLVQLTLSDSRDFGDNQGDQQLVNFQAVRHQPIGGRSSLTGNLSLQYVRHNFDDDGSDNTVTARTGRIDYQNSRVFGFPRLRFHSGFFISKASEEQGIDRAEWENRFDYSIGQLTTSLSFRLIDLDGREYNLSYFNVAREF